MWRPSIPAGVCGAPAGRVDLSPRQAGWLLTALFATAALARISLNHLIPDPTIFSDEMQYVVMARGFLDGHRMLFFGRATAFPNWFYPVLISPILAAWPMIEAQRIIQVLNAVLGALAVLPAYFWARELTSRRRALAAAGLVALLPGLGYGGMVMAECLYLTMMTLALWLIFRALLRPTFERCLLAGLAAGLAFHIKPHALLLPWIVAGVALWQAMDHLRARDNAERRGWPGFWGVLARQWATALGWALGMAPRLLEVALLEHPGERLSVPHILGLYSSVTVGTQQVTLPAFACSLGAYVVGWTITTGLWPSWYLARELRATIALRNDRATRLLSQLTLVATLAVLALIARHTLASDNTWRLHERYFFVMLPPLLILFAARLEAGKTGHRFGILWRFLWVILLAIPGSFIASRIRWHTMNDTPSFTGFVAFVMPEQFPSQRFVAEFSAVSAVVVVLWLLAARRGAWRLAATALLFIWFNAGWYGVQDHLNRQYVKANQAIARKVAERLSRPDKLLVLLDDLPDTLLGPAFFFNPGTGVTLDAKAQTWWTSPLMLGPDLRVWSPFDQQHTWLLASLKWRFNRGPAKTFDQCALYRLSGEPPLALVPGQPLPAGIAAAPDLAAAARPELANLHLAVLTKDVPGAWRVGGKMRVRLRLRNDSLFALPGEEHDWRLGYQWVNPALASGWAPAVRDDGHYARLPKRVAPGEEFDLHLDVAAPPTPAKRWWLLFRIVDLNAGQHLWSKNTVLDAWVSVTPGKEAAAK